MKNSGLMTFWLGALDIFDGGPLLWGVRPTGRDRHSWWPARGAELKPTDHQQPAGGLPRRAKGPRSESPCTYPLDRVVHDRLAPFWDPKGCAWALDNLTLLSLVRILASRQLSDT